VKRPDFQISIQRTGFRRKVFGEKSSEKPPIANNNLELRVILLKPNVSNIYIPEL